jgi:AMMECR1 domain-containing protein
LLLPQVAVEHGWNAMTFLRHTCVKAGLPPDAWQADARLFVFEAQVFGEPEPVRDIVERVDRRG